jgi:hypothetical protein
MIFSTVKKITGTAFGLVIGNFIEWNFHKHVLHGLGKKKDSFWNFHWHKHHKQCRKHMLDKDYQMGFEYLFKTPEFLVLSSAMGLIFKFFGKNFPFISIGIILYGFLYYFIHMRSHLDQTWAEQWIPWHVEHHQKGNQEHSFNVVYPLFDSIFRTRWES